MPWQSCPDETVPGLDSGSVFWSWHCRTYLRICLPALEFDTHPQTLGFRFPFLPALLRVCVYCLLSLVVCVAVRRGRGPSPEGIHLFETC